MITANDLKTRGVSAFATALKSEGEAVISIRGKPRFVVVDIARYERLQDAEIHAAWQEARAAVRKGQYVVETAAKHEARLRRSLKVK
jgi:hypothetical protein